MKKTASSPCMSAMANAIIQAATDALYPWSDGVAGAVVGLELRHGMS